MINRKEKGVSPVIATILMVAITVVLAATVYIMASGLSGYRQQPISGNLVYRSDLSNRTHGYVVFELVQTLPTVPKVSNIHIKLLDANGNPVSNFTYNWTHLTSDPQHVKGGDLLTISLPNTDLTGYKVVLWIDGYTGTIEGKVPPS